MPTYRKKPVEVRAVQIKGEPNAQEVLDFLDELKAPYTVVGPWQFVILTAEGEMAATISDWLIEEPFPLEGRTVYPCKHHMFVKTYEKVKD